MVCYWFLQTGLVATGLVLFSPYRTDDHWSCTSSLHKRLVLFSRHRTGDFYWSCTVSCILRSWSLVLYCFLHIRLMISGFVLFSPHTDDHWSWATFYIYNLYCFLHTGLVIFTDLVLPSTYCAGDHWSGTVSPYKARSHWCCKLKRFLDFSTTKNLINCAESHEQSEYR